MKINQNRPDTQKVPVNVVNTMLEQISDLQEDTAELDARLDQLGTTVDTVNVGADKVETNTLIVSNEASIDDLTVQDVTAQNVNASNISASNSALGEATATSVAASSAEITNLSAANAGIQQLEATNGQIVNLESGRIEANRIETTALEANSIKNNGNYTGKDVAVENVTASDTINAKDLNVTGDTTVNNLNVTGSLTGVSDIVADSIIIEETKSDVAQIDEIKNRITYTDTLHPISPSPSLDNNDAYTIELPAFTGTFILRWVDGNTEMWSATVIGDSKNYTISFASHYEDVGYVQKLFQWNNKLYIRHNANGVLYYSYSAEKKLDNINIYYNMVGWSEPESLEELTPEDYQYDVLRPSGTVMFGAVKIPLLEQNEDSGTINFQGSCTIAEIPPFDEVLPGDVWNITDYGYTDTRFVDGGGKPINIGDDIIAVVDKSDPDNPVLMWDKFAAGVNYEDFVAYDITATHALKSEGTLEVDGTTELHDDVTIDSSADVTATIGNLAVANAGNTTIANTGTTTETYVGAKTVTLTAGETLTGNITQTGNDTIIGKVTIGDLD